MARIETSAEGIAADAAQKALKDATRKYNVISEIRAHVTDILNECEDAVDPRNGVVVDVKWIEAVAEGVIKRLRDEENAAWVEMDKADDAATVAGRAFEATWEKKP